MNRDTENCFFSKIPQWELEEINVDLTLTQHSKTSTDPQILKEGFYNLIYDKYDEFEKIYTDGSKSDTAVGSSAVPMEHGFDEVSKRIPPKASVYTAEATAIDMALNLIGQSNQSSFVIASDSLSCLCALKAYS